MREGIGSVFLYNIIIIFILIVFAFLAGIMSYYKAFKVNTMIVSSIEKYEGYNSLSASEITLKLSTIGYQYSTKSQCRDRNGIKALKNIENVHFFCVYRETEGKYDTYGIVTYITLDMPIIGDYIKIPIYTKSSRLYRFGA